MSIKRAVIIFTVFVIVGLVAMLAIFSRLMLANTEISEKQQIEVELTRSQTSINQQQDDLGALVADWAGWDDPYEYVTNQDEAFIEENIDAAMMQAANLVFTAFLDNSGGVIFARMIDSETAEIVTVPEPISALLENQKKLLVFDKNEDSRLGLVWNGTNPLILVAYPIIGNSRQRPINGTLIMGRLLQSTTVDLGGGAQLTQAVLPLSSVSLDNQGDFLEQIRAGNSVVETTESVITAYRGVVDIIGNKSLLLVVEQPRIMMQQSWQTLWSFGSLLLLLIVLFVAILTYVTNRMVSRPMMLLRKELVELVAQHDFGNRVSVGGLREQQDVSKSINLLMETNQKLAETTLNSTKKMKEQLDQIEFKNEEMEKTKIAVMNILEDERELEEKLREEKLRVEQTVAERTRELIEEQAKLEGSIDSLPVGYLMMDKDGNPVMVNKEARKVLAETEMEKMLVQIKVWLAENHDIKIDETSGLPTSPVQLGGLVNNNGYADLSVVPIEVADDLTNEKEHIGWVALITDVTEAKNLQRSRDEFFSIASHELRTPLTAIRGNTALIKDYYPEIMKDESVHQIIDDIHSASIRLISIVNDFLDASRLELKKIEFKIEDFDILPLVTKVVEAIKPTAAEKQIGLELKTGDMTTLTVSGDLAKTEQIMYNLTGNAIKFTKEGGVTIELRQSEGKAEIWVTDTGLGIPIENQPLLFRKFQQAGESVFTREASQGSGMGLYISKLLAEGMNGLVRLETSELGKGSIFVLSLPIVS